MFFSENRNGLEVMWKNIVAPCKVWLGVEELLIKVERLRNCPRGQGTKMAVKLSTNSHEML